MFAQISWNPICLLSLNQRRLDAFNKQTYLQPLCALPRLWKLSKKSGLPSVPSMVSPLVQLDSVSLPRNLSICTSGCSQITGYLAHAFEPSPITCATCNIGLTTNLTDKPHMLFQLMWCKQSNSQTFVSAFATAHSKNTIHDVGFVVQILNIAGVSHACQAYIAHQNSRQETPNSVEVGNQRTRYKQHEHTRTTEG